MRRIIAAVGFMALSGEVMAAEPLLDQLLRQQAESSRAAHEAEMLRRDIEIRELRAERRALIERERRLRAIPGFGEGDPVIGPAPRRRVPDPVLCDTAHMGGFSNTICHQP